jgi:AraC-like DNA-binding protein
MNVKKTDKYEVHRMPKGIQNFHRAYGLWICHVGQGNYSAGGFTACRERYFEYYSISHMFEGAGRLWMAPDHEVEIAAGQGIIVPPGRVNRYGANDDALYVEDAICFTGPVADALLKTGIMRTGRINIGKARRLLPIIEIARDPAVSAQIHANLMLQKLILDLYHENMVEQHKNKYSIIDQLIEELKTSVERWWTVPEMAEFCNLSIDQFRRVFIQHTGILPKTYFDRLKLQRAVNLLVSTDLTVAEIGTQLGYMDPFHFSRRFKELIGYSPKKYREVFASGSTQA